MRFLRRSLVGLFLIAVTVGVLALAGQVGWRAVQARMSEEPPGRRAEERVFAVNVVTVAPGTLTPVLEVYGEVRSTRTLELRATAGGRVAWLSDAFVEGGTVRAGEPLLRIDPLEAEGALSLARSDLAEARAEQADATAALALARDDLEQAQAQAALREQALTRQRDARSRGVGTDTLVEEAELAVAAGRQSVLSRRQAVAQAEGRVALAATRLDRQAILVAEAERALARTEITAEFDGALSGVTLVEGRMVSVNERLAELVDPHALEVAFRLSAGEYARLLDPAGGLLPAGVAVRLGVEGIDLTATGRIARQGAAVGTGQTGRQLFAALDGSGGLRPGDFVSVRIEEPPLEGVAFLPATAVGADQSVLAVGEGERLERLPVEVVRRQGDDVIVAAAALAGRDLVAERTPLLGPGIRVRPLRPGAEAATATAQAEVAEMVELTDERRAKLVAFVEGSSFLPDDAKRRVLAQLAEPKVPATVVARIESRMGG
jgi:multidrug efflux pump subunit AcrA (membrane-fusion protein)